MDLFAFYLCVHLMPGHRLGQEHGTLQVSAIYVVISLFRNLQQGFFPLDTDTIDQDVRRTHLPCRPINKGANTFHRLNIYLEAMDIMTARPLILYLEEKDRDRCFGRRVLLVEDVVSTGSASRVMREVMDRSGAEVVGEMAVFTEGRTDRWPNVVALGHLPLFASELD